MELQLSCYVNYYWSAMEVAVKIWRIFNPLFLTQHLSDMASAVSFLLLFFFLIFNFTTIVYYGICAY